MVATDHTLISKRHGANSKTAFGTRQMQLHPSQVCATRISEMLGLDLPVRFLP